MHSSQKPKAKRRKFDANALPTRPTATYYCTCIDPAWSTMGESEMRLMRVFPSELPVAGNPWSQPTHTEWVSEWESGREQGDDLGSWISAWSQRIIVCCKVGNQLFWLAGCWHFYFNLNDFPNVVHNTVQTHTHTHTSYLALGRGLEGKSGITDCRGMWHRDPYPAILPTVR